MATTVSAAPSPREVEDLLQPQRKLLARLRGAEAISTSELTEAVGQVTELAAAVLNVERASVWRLTEEGKRIDCIDLFVRTKRTHSAEGTIAMADCPAYFAALRTERTIGADDAHTDPRTAEFSAGYLTPHGIGAMLDAPIFLRGQMVGVVCHEHVGGARSWSLWEEVVAGTLADFVAHVLEVEERAKELRESEENFRRLFDAAPTPLVLTRISDGTIGLLNSRARDVIGAGEAEPYTLIASHLYESPLDREAVLEEVRAHGFVDNRELRMRTLDGSQRHCLLSARSLVFRGEPHVAVGFIDISEMKKIEQQLRDAAMRDALTGIHNRRHFYEVGTRELDRARRYERPLALAMLDADHFKAVNDKYGHVVGDEVLIAIAKLTSAELRRTDVVARYGGEELVVLFTETEIDEAERVTERVRETIAKTPIFTSAGPLSITLSGGVVAWSIADGTLEALIERADRALYRAKESGRNRVIRG